MYQRTPNWNSPLNNGKITDEEQAEIQATYDQIYESCMASFAGFVHPASRKHAFDDSKEERWALYERLYHQRGFSKLISNYRDTMTNREANAEFSEFIAEKIHARVDDPVLAEKLIPTDHGFGMRRPPMELLLRGLQPAQRAPGRSQRDPDHHHHRGRHRDHRRRAAFDIIVWATGFDGFTGALTRMDVIGEGGQVLRDRWADGVVTYLGAMVPGFPNFFTAGGPHMIGGNFPWATEIMVDYITGVLGHARATATRSSHQTPTRLGVDRRGAPGRQDRPHGRELLVPWCQHPGQDARVPAYAGSLAKFRRAGRHGRTGLPGPHLRRPRPELTSTGAWSHGVARGDIVRDGEQWHTPQSGAGEGAQAQPSATKRWLCSDPSSCP